MSGGHVFISYARNDAGEADEMEEALAAAGIPVWRDTAQLWPGDNWHLKIKQAIAEDALVMIACFSERSLARTVGYQNEELALAIEQLRLRRPDVPWLIPVRFDDCKIPDLDIGGGHTLSSLQRADLFGAQTAEETARLVEAVRRILDRGQSEPAGDPARAPERMLTDVRPGSAGGAKPGGLGAMPLEPDGRWESISGGKGPDGRMRPMSFEILAGLASEWAALLPDHMINDGPAKLLRMSRSQFTYSWFNYEFMVTACLTGFQALEAAFRVLYPEAERTAFRALIDRARREGVLPDNIAALAGTAAELHALFSRPLTQAALTLEEAVPMLEDSHRLVALVMNAASARDAAWRAHYAALPDQPETAGLTVGLLERARAVHPMLGHRQAEVLLELAKAGPAGASCGKIATAISYDEPNCHIALSALVGKSLVDKDTSTYPHTYRLTPPFLDRDVSAESAQAAGRPANWRLIKDAATALSPDARPADARADARAPVAMACTADIQSGIRLLSMLTNVGEPGKFFAEGTAMSRSDGVAITRRRWRVPWEDDRSGNQRHLDKRGSARLNLATWDIAACRLWLAGTRDDLSEDFSVPLEPGDQLQLEVTITRGDAATSAIAAFVIELDSGENLRFRAL